MIYRNMQKADELLRLTASPALKATKEIKKEILQKNHRLNEKVTADLIVKYEGRPAELAAAFYALGYGTRTLWERELTMHIMKHGTAAYASEAWVDEDTLKTAFDLAGLPESKQDLLLELYASTEGFLDRALFSRGILAGLTVATDVIRGR